MPHANADQRKNYHREYMGRWRKNSPIYREWLRAYMREYAQRPGVLARERKRLGYPEPTRPMPEACELCGGGSNGNGRLHLDHDHLFGNFRGWLCYKCNGGLGLFGDNIAGLERALAYLKRAEEI